MREKMEMERNSSISTKTLSVVQVALMAALTYIATAVIPIPIGNNGVLHIGDSLLFVSVILLGKKKGAIAAAIGMACFDLFSAYYVWAPFTLLIKWTMAYIAGAIAFRKDKNGEDVLNNLAGFIVGGIVMVILYFIAGGVLNFYVAGLPSLKVAYGVALSHVPFNILQVIAGIVIAIPLSIPLKKHLGRYIV